MSTEDRWRDPAWTAAAHAWIDDRLAALGRGRTGEVEQPHVRSWGTVMRVPTADGVVWFKATEESLAHEGAAHELIAARSPEVVPPLLAHDPASGWMLAEDAGRTLQAVVAEERSLGRWYDVLPAYARVQLACEPDVPALLAAGVPHRPLDRLSADYADLVDRLDAGARLRDAGDRIGSMVATVQAPGIAETVQHDDLHDSQVFVRPDGAHVVLDWGDACVTHPFLTLAVTLLGVIAWGVDDRAGSEDVAPYRDAYLAPYAEAYGTTVAELADAADVATRLGWALRAVNGHVQGDEASTLTRLRMFADGRP